MTRRHVLVIGTSHTRALSDALSDEPADEAVLIESHWLQSQKADRVVGDLPYEEALDRVASLGPDDVFVLAVFGTLHNVYGLLRHEQPFWLAPGPGEPAEHPPEATTLIPRRAIEAWFESLSRGNKRVDAMLARCRARRYHLMTPPPKGDNSFIAARTSRYRERELNELTVAPAVQRKRLWSCERQALAAALRPQEVALLDPPEAAFGADGCLEPVYYGPDATHANAAYGRLVLRQLRALAGAGRAAEGA